MSTFGLVQPEYLEIINIHNNDRFIEEFHRFLVYACIRTRLLVTPRGFLGKELKDIQEGDLVALVAGVNMPMIIWKKGSSYRSKSPAYIHKHDVRRNVAGGRERLD
jgi:hypothetical protein